MLTSQKHLQYYTNTETPPGSQLTFLLTFRRNTMSTQLKTFDATALTNLNRALVGFDRIFNSRLNNLYNNYPPHNVIKYDDDHYAVEVAVAGFAKDEISVQVDQDQLTITGTKAESLDRKEYLHKGLATRNFEQVYTLAEYMEVKSAEVRDGMLIINIERIIPDALKPRRIEIQ